MTQSRIQKPLGAMLLASGVTLAIVVLGGETIRALKGTTLMQSSANETVSVPAWGNFQNRSQPWPSERSRVEASWNGPPQHSSVGQRPNSYQQVQPATIDQARQVSYVAESTFANENFSRRPEQRLPNQGAYKNTNYPAIEYSNLPQTNQPQSNAYQPVAPPRATPSYPPAQRLGREQITTATHSDLEPMARRNEPTLAVRPATDELQHSELAQQPTRQEPKETFSVLQTNFETRILKPDSRISAPHLTSQIRIDKQGLKTTQNEILIEAPAEPTPPPTNQPSLALRSTQQQVLPRRRVNPQAEVLAKKRIQYGESLSRRRSFYAAREEFILALLLISNSHDTGANANAHAGRLAGALNALDEMNDFVSMRSSTGHDVRFQQAVLSHKTPLLDGADLTKISPMKAVDLYCGFAQSQIEQAIGFSTAGSEALHALGKLETMASNNGSQGNSTSQTKALVFFRAALSVNRSNALCANDLGVLLFNMGRLSEAEETFKVSLGHTQSRLVWSNLASVHSQQASLATSPEQRNQRLRLTKMAEVEAQKLQNNPRDQGLADNEWATTTDFQNKAAIPDTVVQRASGSPNQTTQPRSSRVKAVSFLQKVTGWN